MLLNQPNIEVRKEFFTAEFNDNEKNNFLDDLIRTFRTDIYKADYVRIDFRVFAWALLN